MLRLRALLEVAPLVGYSDLETQIQASVFM